MSEANGSGSGRRPRPGRRALFSGSGDSPGEPGALGPGAGDPPAGGPSPRRGRQALFSPQVADVTPDRSTAVVHCRTCLAETRVSLARLAAALVPSLWLPARPWPRLMRCPACHRVSWCRIDWPRLG